MARTRDATGGEMLLGLTYEAQRKYPEAIAEFKKIGSSLGVAHVYAVSGDEAKARLFLPKLRQKASTNYVPHKAFALVLVGLRENDAAIAELEKADMEGEPLDYVNQDSRSKPLRSDPRFQALLRRHHTYLTSRRTLPARPPTFAVHGHCNTV
jgi:hypothetical protein